MVIASMRLQGKNVRAIARTLFWPPSTMSRDTLVDRFQAKSKLLHKRDRQGALDHATRIGPDLCRPSLRMPVVSLTT
jgi:hypothetical protein